MHYVLYLDEFGHPGPYIARNDSRHNTSPIFGLGGFFLPVEKVRAFSTYFFQLKNRLCRDELASHATPAYQWEIKSSAVYRPKNIQNYPELRRTTNRLLNRITSDAGQVFYVGILKYMTPEESDSAKLYTAVLREAIKRVDTYCQKHGATFSIVMDQCGDMQQGSTLRNVVVAQASMEMFGTAHRQCLVEPPMQVESHLYQTVQCADWLCGLIGKIQTYAVMSANYPEYECFQTYFGERLSNAAPLSGLRRTIPSHE